MEGKNLNAVSTLDGGFLEVHWCAYNDELVKIEEIYQNNPSELLSFSKYGNNCLHIAAVSNSPRVLGFLLELKELSLINTSNKWGETPLHLATAAVNTDVLVKLINAGADYLLKDCWGRTPKTVALQNGNNSCLEILQTFDPSNGENWQEETANPREQCALSSSIYQDITREFLQIQKTRIEAAQQAQVIEKQMFSETISLVVPQPQPPPPPPTAMSQISSLSNLVSLPALSKFVEYPGNPEQLSKLLSEEKVNPAGADMLGYTALHKFSSWDKVDLLDLLCPHLSGAQIMTPAGGKSDSNHFTCLHLCVEMKSWRALKYLTANHNVTRFGINLEVKDRHDRTFKDLLREHLARGEVQSDEILEFLS